MTPDGAVPKWDLLLVVTSGRYGSERFGTVQRLIDAALSHGCSIQVWACGYATMLTQRAADAPAADERHADAACASAGAPAGHAGLIGGLVSDNPERFSWLACRTCSDDLGTGEHIPEVPSPSLSEFRQYADQAAKVIYIGGE